LATVKKIFSSETTWPNRAKLGRKHLCKVLYKVSSFHSVWPTNMAAKSDSVSEEIFLIVASQKKELLLAAMFIGRMEPNEEAL
jgi:hypothetical protein